MNVIGTYAFVNAKVRAMRSTLLDESHMRRLMQVVSYRDLLVQLAEYGYGDLTQEIGTHQPERLEAALFRVEVNRLLKIRKSCKGTLKDFVDLLLERYEAERIKRMLRIWFQHKNKRNSDDAGLQFSLPGTILYELPVEKLIGLNSLAEMLPYFAGTPYAAVITDNLAEVEQKKSLFAIELAIDRLELQWFFDKIRRFNSRDQRIVRRLTGVETDIRNLAWIGRFKQYYGMSSAEIADKLLPGGHQLTSSRLRDVIAEKNISGVLRTMMKGFTQLIPAEMEGTVMFEALEKFMDQVLLMEARRAFREFPFSIGALMGYTYLMHIEMRNIRTIAGAKFYQLPVEDVEQLLVM